MKKLQNLLIYFSCVVVLVLSGCASKSTKPPALPSEKSAQKMSPEKLWEAHLRYLQKMQNWQMEGRIAATQGQEGGNASFVWRQMGESYQIKFFGPFGAGSVSVNGSPKQVSLKEADGKVHHAQTTEELMKKVAGWHVPLTGIRYWMLGIPTPKTKVQEQHINPQGHLNQLQQLNWVIDFSNYQSHHSVPIPSKLHMESGPLKVKIIVKSWKDLSAG
ncbi:MAG: lipoprotein insertase outer membrane protein LolB [Candidatus Berkiella sp.]